MLFFFCTKMADLKDNFILNALNLVQPDVFANLSHEQLLAIFLKHLAMKEQDLLKCKDLCNVMTNREKLFQQVLQQKDEEIKSLQNQLSNPKKRKHLNDDQEEISEQLCDLAKCIVYAQSLSINRNPLLKLVFKRKKRSEPLPLHKVIELLLDSFTTFSTGPIDPKDIPANEEEHQDENEKESYILCSTKNSTNNNSEQPQRYVQPRDENKPRCGCKDCNFVPLSGIKGIV